MIRQLRSLCQVSWVFGPRRSAPHPGAPSAGSVSEAQQRSWQNPWAGLPSLELVMPLERAPERAGCGWGAEQVEPGEPWRLSEQSCPCRLGLVGGLEASGAQSFTPVSFSWKTASCFRGLAWLVLDTHLGHEGKSER